jgi:hypothetical protein
VDSGLCRGEERRCLSGGFPVGSRVPGRAGKHAVPRDDEHAAEQRRRALTLARYDGGHSERRVAVEQRPQPRTGGDRCRGGGGLHEDIDGAVAAEAKTPDRLVAAAGVVVEESGGIGPECGERPLAHVRLEATTAHVSQHRAVIGDEQLGAGAPIGGALDAHDCGQGGPPARLGQGGGVRKDLGGLVPVLH